MTFCFRITVTCLLLASSLSAVRAQPVVPFEDVPWIGYNVGVSAFPGNPTPLERDPYTLTSADFDGDGDLDLAVANYDYASPGGTSGQSGFVLLFNDGDGVYGDPVHYTVSTKGHFDIVAADFDEDGDADLLMPHSGRISLGSETGNTVILFLNDGSGGFTSGGEFVVTEEPLYIDLGDFNADGHLDVVTGTNEFQDHAVGILLGTGTGSFEPVQFVPVGNSPDWVAAGDFNGDGFDDFATSSVGDLYIVLNDGAGSFQAAQMLTDPGPLDPVVGLLISEDIDQDGNLDLIHGASQSSGTGGNHIGDDLTIRYGNGDGTFQDGVYFDLAAYVTGPEAIVPVDLDGDGDLDLAMCDWSGRTGDGLLLAFNDGARGFGNVRHVPAGQGTHDLTVGDIDGDGDPDVMASDQMSMAVTVHRNPGDGQFPILDVQYPTGSSVLLHTVAGDVDGDGDLDLFASSESFGTAGSLLRNNGDGTFAPPVLYTHSDEYGRGVSTAKLRDLDGDGDLDLLYNDPHTDFHDGYDFYTGLNDGTGTFGPLTQWPQNTCGNGGIDAFDIDNDGDLDVINTEELGCAGSNSANKLYVNLNNGDATFQPPTLIEISLGPHAIAGGDFNDDGNVDLVTTHWMPYGLRDYLNVHLGNGDGTFQEEVVYPVGQGPRYIVVRDLNGDGHEDFATANSSSGNTGRETLTVLFGTGTGTFTGRTDYYAPYSPDLQGVTGIDAGDLDGDGDLDLVLTTVANGAALYLNDGTGAYSFPYRLGVYWDAGSPVLADLDGDSVLDLATLVGIPPSGIGANLAVQRGLTGTIPTDTDPGRTPVADLPSGYRLSAVYPNPFNPTAQFTLEIAQAQDVTIAVFDALGRRVATLQDGRLPSGAEHAFAISGAGLPSGVYVVRAVGETFRSTRTVTLLK